MLRPGPSVSPRAWKPVSCLLLRTGVWRQPLPLDPPLEPSAGRRARAAPPRRWSRPSLAVAGPPPGAQLAQGGHLTGSLLGLYCFTLTFPGSCKLHTCTFCVGAGAWGWGAWGWCRDGLTCPTPAPICPPYRNSRSFQQFAVKKTSKTTPQKQNFPMRLVRGKKSSSLRLRYTRCKAWGPVAVPASSGPGGVGAWRPTAGVGIQGPKRHCGRRGLGTPMLWLILNLEHSVSWLGVAFIFP